MSQSAIDFDDLLGAPYLDGGCDPATGIDCWGVMRLVLFRGGLRAPRALAGVDGLFARLSTGMSLAQAVGAVRVADRFGPDSRVCDVLAMDTRALGRCTHVATVVCLSPPLALHCANGAGVLASHPRRLGHVLGVYRFPAVDEEPAAVRA